MANTFDVSYDVTSVSTATPGAKRRHHTSFGNFIERPRSPSLLSILAYSYLLHRDTVIRPFQPHQADNRCASSTHLEHGLSQTRYSHVSDVSHHLTQRCCLSAVCMVEGQSSRRKLTVPDFLCFRTRFHALRIRPSLDCFVSLQL